MGITGLLPFLSNIHKKVHVSQFTGKCVAVDTSCWLHRAAYCCAFELATGQPTDKYVNYIVKRLRLLLHHGVYPIMVFDGCPTPSKRGTNDKRREIRQANKEKGRQFLAEGNKSAATDMFQKSISITTEMVTEVIRQCRGMNVPVIVAPYEADAQLTYLVNSGIADLAITEDSDLLPFGCKRVLFKMDENGGAMEIDLADLGKNTEEPRFDGWTIDKFRKMCIISGCDYLERLPKAGLKTVHKQFRKFTNVDRGIKAFISNHNMKNSTSNIDTKEYYEKFQAADQAFHHHLVFDPTAECIIPLHPLPPHLDITELPFLGEVFPKAKAIEHACGNINPHNGDKIASFPPSHVKIKRTCEEWRRTGGKLDGSTRVKAVLKHEGSALNKWDPVLKGSTSVSRGGDSGKENKERNGARATPQLVKRPANVPQMLKVPLEDGDEDQLVKLYGTGKRRKIIPNVTEQKSCYFRPASQTDNPFAKQKSTEDDTSSSFLSTDSPPQQKPKSLSNLFSKSKEITSPKKTHHAIKEIAASKSPEKFRSMFSQHTVTSHSSAISLQKTIADKLISNSGPDSSPEITRIPSPLKKSSPKLGLLRKVPKPSQPVKSAVGTLSGKWICTQQSSARSSGSSQKTIEPAKVTGSSAKVTGSCGKKTVNLEMKTKTKQRTLTGFVKSDDTSSSSKYF